MKLYCYTLCPFSRTVRVILNENSVEYTVMNVKLQDDILNFKTENEWLHLPVLVIDNKKKTQISGEAAILFYLYENKIITRLPMEKALEIERIVERFNSFFFADVSWKLLSEKVLFYKESGHYPDSSAIRSATNKIKSYMEELAWFIDRRNWLAGDDFSLADITVASHLSCIDYLGAIDWNNYELVKNWYMRVKCRPSFQPLLFERVPGILPVSTYSALDF